MLSVTEARPDSCVSGLKDRAARHPRAALAAAALLAAAWLSLLYASVCERAIWHTHHSAHKVDTGICGGALRG